MNNQSTVIVPWDFSEQAFAALRYAQEKFTSGKIKVICVLEPPNPYQPGFNWGEEAFEKAAQNCRETFRERVPFDEEAPIELTIEFGDPTDQILQFANQSAADCIVMSTHGRTGLNRIFMGSVAQKVLVAANCPVVVLPPNWVKSNLAVDQEFNVAES